jgi:Holliday junction DNA helicase RuvA
MISQLTGTVARTEGNSVVLDVGGVGYQVFVPVTVLSALPGQGAKTTLLTHLIVREDELTLYGFATHTDLQAFKIVLSVAGVGPKVGLALLSTLDASELSRALSTSDTKSITRVPGVGPKLAQRLCLELGDKMAAFAFEQRTEQSVEGRDTARQNAAHEEAIDGLLNLGYSRADARRTVDRVFANAADRADVSTLIRESLSILTSKR